MSFPTKTGSVIICVYKISVILLINLYIIIKSLVVTMGIVILLIVSTDVFQNYVFNTLDYFYDTTQLKTTFKTESFNIFAIYSYFICL